MRVPVGPSYSTQYANAPACEMGKSISIGLATFVGSLAHRVQKGVRRNWKERYSLALAEAVAIKRAAVEREIGLEDAIAGCGRTAIDRYA